MRERPGQKMLYRRLWSIREIVLDEKSKGNNHEPNKKMAAYEEFATFINKTKQLSQAALIDQSTGLNEMADFCPAPRLAAVTLPGGGAGRSNLEFQTANPGGIGKTALRGS